MKAVQALLRRRRAAKATTSPSPATTSAATTARVPLTYEDVELLRRAGLQVILGTYQKFVLRFYLLLLCSVVVHIHVQKFQLL